MDSKTPKFISCKFLIKKKIKIFGTESLYSKKIIARNGKEIIETGENGQLQEGASSEQEICKYLKGQVEKGFYFFKGE